MSNNIDSQHPDHQSDKIANTADMLCQEDLNIIYRYLTCLYNNYGTYLKSGTALHTLAVPYDKGVILEIGYSSLGKIEVEVDKSIQKDVAKAFSKLKLDIRSVLSPEEQIQYNQALNNNELIFSGTGFLGTESKLYIIKDYSKDQWTEGAAKKDIENILTACYN